MSPTRVPSASPAFSLLEDALNTLDRAVTFSPAETAPSHMVVSAVGLDHPSVPEALGCYLVGALAGAVDYDARLCEDLLAQGADRRAEISQSVSKILGSTNAFTTAEEKRFRDTHRNAWLGEGIAHALLMLAARAHTSCVDGQVCTLSEIHPEATRQGLDSVGTYVQGGLLGVVIGESKATRAGGSVQLGLAADMFSNIDKGIYGPDLRARLLAFRRFLPAALVPQVSERLWSDNASYLPMIVYQEEFNLLSRRPKLESLMPPVERRRVLVVRLTAFHAFFDQVADAMRGAISKVVI